MSELNKYQVIYNDLVEQINNKTYLENDKLPSENQLSKKYGVSRITVSTALNLLVKDGYVIRKQGKGSFVVPQRKNEKYNNSLIDILNPKKIGMLIPSICDNHSLTLVYTIGLHFHFPEYQLCIIQSYSSKYEEYTIQTLRDEGYDGLIIFPIDDEIYNETILTLQIEHFPYVLIDRNLPGINCSYIISDNLYGGHLCAKHLLELKHTNIIFCATSSISEQGTALRYKGFCEEMAKNDVFIDEETSFINIFNTKSSEIVSKIKSSKTTAAITSNGYTAHFLLDLCNKNKIRVPEDFSIITFDPPAIVKSSYDFLTYIEQGSFEIATKASKALIDLIKNPTSSPKQEVITPKLVKNSSTTANK